ncbi:MAG: hypothetical protein LBI13_00815, partial [Streptococcaceae bacterium]|nr:hypothetical protein [Streptococcaceae bacterium]
MKKKKILAFYIALILGLACIISGAGKADTTTLLLNKKYSSWLSSQTTVLSKKEAQVSLIGNPDSALKEGQAVSYSVNAPSDGLYRIALAYLSRTNSLISPEFSVQINGAFEYYEAQNITAPTLWKDKSNHFLTNESGDDLVAEQVVDEKSNHIILNDASYDQQNGLLFYFHAGKNELTLTMTAGDFQINNLEVIAGKSLLPSYESYRKTFPKSDSSSTLKNLITFEAENTSFKDTSYAQPQRMKTPLVSPYSSKEQLFNVFGGDSWKDSGQAVSWEFNVDKEGLYTLTVKNQQNNNGKAVFRTIAIDGKTPFSELQAYRFDTNSDWTNTTLEAETQAKANYQFYFSKGKHTLTMTATDAPVSSQINKLDETMKEINDLGLQIQKLTGNSNNANYQWKLSDYIPDINSKLSNWLRDLADIQRTTEKIYGSQNSKAQELVQLKLVIAQLKGLAKSPDLLPSKWADLSQGSASVTNTLATIEQDMQAQPLTIDKFYLSAGESIPSAKVSWWKSFTSSIAEFFSSFGKSKQANPKTRNQKTVPVWV